MSAKLIHSPEDKTPGDALSPSIAKTILTQSLEKVRHDLDNRRASSRAMDAGTIVHGLLLRKTSEVIVINHDNYRTKAAQAARDTAIMSGATPILEREYAQYKKAAEAIGGKLANEGIALEGHVEQKIEWTADGVLCRGIPDVFTQDGQIYDLKTTGNCAPQDLGRTMYSLGIDVQAAAYIEAVEMLNEGLQGRARFTAIFCELEPPYAVTIAELDGMFRGLGALRWARAKLLWSRALETGQWPGYEPVRVSPPRWALIAEGME